MSKLTERISELARSLAEKMGYELWGVEFQKEGGKSFLRIYLDKEGGISISDCEHFSRAFDPILDEEDPIAESYIFEVSSAGAERELKRDSDFQRFLGHTVEVRLFKNLDGSKSHIGKLISHGDGKLVIEANGSEKSIDKKEISQVRLRISI